MLGVIPQQGTFDNCELYPTGVLPVRTHSGHYKAMLPHSIASLRIARGMSQTELAERIGTTLSMLGKLERGERKLTSDWIDKLSGALGVEPSAILQPPVESGPQPVRPRPPSVRSDHAPTVTIGVGEIVEIPRLDLSLAMGAGTNIDEDYIEVETVSFDRGFLRSITPSSPSNLRLISGVGDSMFPTLLDTDLMFLDVGQRVMNMQDRIWGISLYGAGALKRLRAIDKSHILVISDNPAIENQEVHVDDLYIGGRLTGAFRRH